jgi:SAM-dependent methyltransferase
MLDEAHRLDFEDGASVEYRQAITEDTGLPAARFDAVVADQCGHWFDRGAAEALQVLVSGGAVVIAHFDWPPLPGNGSLRRSGSSKRTTRRGPWAGIYPQ